MLDFRPGTAQDGPHLLRLHQRAIFVLGQDFYDMKTLESWAHGLRVDGYRQVMEEGEQFELAVSDDRILGFCSTKQTQIYGLFVDPDMARRGVGSALLARATKRLQATHPRQALSLMASLAAVDFYTHHGWRETCRRADVTRGGLPMDVVDMEFPIAKP